MSSPMKTKIAHLTTVHSLLDNRIFHKECKTLAGAGFDVVLIGPHGLENVENIVDGVRVRMIPKPKNRLFRMTCTAWQTLRVVLSEKPSISHLHDPELLPWGWLLRFLSESLVVYDMHENVPKQLLTKSWLPSVLRPLIAFIFKNFERLLLIGIPVIYAEKSYVPDYPWVKKSVVVLNMPLTEQLVEINEQKYEKPTVGYIGGVHPLRGSLMTLEALGNLSKEGVFVGWECIGPIEKDHENQLREHIKLLNLKVKLRGYLGSLDGCRIISRCHIGLAVLHPIPNYLESFPTKLFEYMALGIPVVASNFPLYKQVVEAHGCGLCVDPVNAKDIAMAIRWLLENPVKAREMGERGRSAVAEKFNWKNEGEKLIDFYREFIGHPHATSDGVVCPKV